MPSSWRGCAKRPGALLGGASPGSCTGFGECGSSGYLAVRADYRIYHLLPDETPARLLLKQIWIPVAKDGGADS